MSYKTNNDLPDAIKNTLPEEAQSIYRSAYNAAYDDGKRGVSSYWERHQSCEKCAWDAVEKAGWQNQDGAWAKSYANMHEFDAEVFSAGTWNGDEYTVADLDDMVENFEALRSVVKPPIKPGHTGGHGKPGDMAFGWVTALRRQGEKLLATFSQVPAIVYKAIQAGRFKRVSAEIIWNYRHAGRVFKRVFAGASVLGADLPAVTNLADLEAYLVQSSDGTSGTFERAAAYGWTWDGLHIDDKETGGNEMADDKEKQYQEQLAAEKQAREAAEAQVKEYKAQIDAEQARQEAERKAARTAEFAAYCEQCVKDGIMTPAARDVIVAGLDKRAYTDAAGYSLSAEEFKAFISKQGKILPMGEAGAGGSEPSAFEDAGREVDRRTRELMAEKKLDYSAAMKAVFAADAELARVYREQAVKVSRLE